MATANPSLRRPRRSGRPRRLVLVLAVAVLVLGALFWSPLHERALAGASFGARIGCSCRYVEGRPLGDCRKDFEPGMALVLLSADEETSSVTARVPLLARQTASFVSGRGCALEPWQD